LHDPSSPCHAGDNDDMAETITWTGDSGGVYEARPDGSGGYNMFVNGEWQSGPFSVEHVREFQALTTGRPEAAHS
jgi:hypothetical protein